MDNDELDVLFDIIANPRRRDLLRLLSQESPLTVTQVAEKLATIEQETPRTALSNETIQRITVSLHHTHLPKLADANVVVYEQYHGVVVLLNTPQQEWLTEKLQNTILAAR